MRAGLRGLSSNVTLCRQAKPNASWNGVGGIGGAHGLTRSGKLHPSKEVRHATEDSGACLFTVVGCLAATEASAQVVKQEVPGIRNFAKIESTVACAGAITPGAIPEIKKMGYASIINLRLATEQGADIDGHIAVRRRPAFPTTTSHSVRRRRIPRSSTRS